MMDAPENLISSAAKEDKTAAYILMNYKVHELEAQPTFDVEIDFRKINIGLKICLILY